MGKKMERNGGPRAGVFLGDTMGQTEKAGQTLVGMDASLHDIRTP